PSGAKRERTGKTLGELALVALDERTELGAGGRIGIVFEPRLRSLEQILSNHRAGSTTARRAPRPQPEPGWRRVNDALGPSPASANCPQAAATSSPRRRRTKHNWRASVSTF